MHRLIPACSRTANDLRYAYKEDSVIWNIQDVAETTYTPTSTSLVLDGAGNPHIAFLTQSGVYGDYTLQLAAWDGQQWQLDPLDPLATLADYTEPRLAIDAQDHLHLAYTSWGHPAYATETASGWELIDSIDAPPIDPDFSFSPTSNVALSFDEQGSPLLIYDGEMDLKAASMTMIYLTFLPLAVR